MKRSLLCLFVGHFSHFRCEHNPEEEDSKPPAIDTRAAAAASSAGTSASGGALAIMSSRSTGTVDASARALLSTSLIRMTDGLPRRELKLIIAEAEQCEKALQEEIDILNKALEVERRKTKKKKNTTTEATGSTIGGEDRKGQKEEDGDVKMDDKTEAAINTMVESEITPPDQFWTLSALLGRLRHDLTTPLPPQSQIPFAREQNGLGPLEAQLARKIPPYLKKKRGSLLNQQQTTFATSTGTASAAGGSGSGTTTPAGSGRSTPVSGAVGGGRDNATSSSSVEISQFQRLLDIEDHPVYTREHNNPDQLISLWKKISMHKSSLVFRKPVNPKEAPGYTDRIMFPMDLSVMRKLILARTMKSYKDFSQRVALISHNCVKYNGRESDYALVAREFESVCSEFIWIAVQDEIAEGATAAGLSSAAISAPAAAAAAAAATLATKSTFSENAASSEKNVDTSEKPPPSSAAAAATTATAGGGSSDKDTATADGTDNTDKKRKHDEVVAAAGTDDKDQEKEPPAKESKKTSD
mmetsp:Transcript_54208/g.131528  ORF Transcript_54208/g.131528 Transcript_54208/m.131528 type:complete len:527 (+) Transcript_54208:48-1628(+)